MPSRVAWLDHSEVELRQMLDLVNQFRDRSIVDELGLGSVRDAIADRLFPGTSTVMTRARYYLMVPWLCQQIEARQKSGDEFRKALKDAETKLVFAIRESAIRESAIRESNHHDGNIGQRAAGKPKRPPSSIYWAGLGAWGLRVKDVSIADYISDLRSVYAQRARQRLRRSAEDGEHSGSVDSIWHGGLIAAPEEFPQTASLKMSRRESVYLKERVNDATRGSVLPHLLEQGRQAAYEAAFIWDHAGQAEWPKELRDDVNEARRFSLLMFGAVTLYHLLLCQRTKREEDEANVREELEQWAAQMQAAMPDLRAWDRDAFEDLVRQLHPRVPPRTLGFVRDWGSLCLKLDQRALARLDQQRVHTELLAARERMIKPAHLARLTNRAVQQRWEGPPVLRPLDFRWGITRRLLIDIFDGYGEDGADT